MFYPLMIDLNDKIVCVVGAGGVALRKTTKFLEYGATVKVIGREIKEEFSELKSKYEGRLQILKGDFKEEYLQGVFMAEIATNDCNINERVATMCKDRNILCSLADNIKKCDYIVPSTVKRGSLIFSISTLGKSPSLCAKVRKELEEKYPESMADFVELLGQGRELVLNKIQNAEERRSILNKMVYMDFEELKKVVDQLKG